MAYPPTSNKDYKITTDGNKHVNVKFAPFLPDSSGFYEQNYSLEIKLLGLGLGDNANRANQLMVYKEASVANGEFLQLCCRCGDKHIKMGSLSSLPDRDTCGAYLPSWYPAKKFLEKGKDPWLEFRGLWSEVVYLIISARDPSYPISGVKIFVPTPRTHFHKFNPEFLEVTDAEGKPKYPNGFGVWTCRRGMNASDVEKSCEICHKKGEQGVLEGYEVIKEVKDRFEAMAEWVNSVLEHMGYEKGPASAAEAVVLRLGFDRIGRFLFQPVEVKEKEGAKEEKADENTPPARKEEAEEKESAMGSGEVPSSLLFDDMYN